MIEKQAFIILRSCLKQNNCTLTRKSVFLTNVFTQVTTEFAEYMKIVVTYFKWDHLLKCLVLNIYTRGERNWRKIISDTYISLRFYSSLFHSLSSNSLYKSQNFTLNLTIGTNYKF